MSSFDPALAITSVECQLTMMKIGKLPLNIIAFKASAAADVSYDDTTTLTQRWILVIILQPNLSGPTVVVTHCGLYMHVQSQLKDRGGKIFRFWL